MDSDLLHQLLSEDHALLDAGQLSGTVRVISHAKLLEILTQREEETRSSVVREALGSGDIPKMLDDYMRENVDLKMRARSAEQKVRDYEEKLESLEGAGGAPAQDADVSSFLAFDTETVRTEVEGLEEKLAETEAALNEVGNMEESWVFIEKVADVRNDQGRIRETYETHSARLASYAQGEGASPVDVVVSAKELEKILAETRTAVRFVTFIQGLLGIEE
jgi:hypothetical protein